MKTLARNPGIHTGNNTSHGAGKLHMTQLRALLRAQWRVFATLFVTLMLVSSQAFAQGYQVITPAQNTTDPEKVEVLEFFWFGCPHCYSFEPSIEEWASNIPENTVFVREAPPLNPSWETHSKAFYASQILGIDKEFIPAMFKAIHEDRKKMRKPSDVAELAATFGVEEKAFTDAMNSFGVKTRINRSLQLAQGTGISGVPAVIVNGKYRINSESAGNHQGMINAINQAVESEKKSMGLE